MGETSFDGQITTREQVGTCSVFVICGLTSTSRATAVVDGHGLEDLSAEQARAIGQALIAAAARAEQLAAQMTDRVCRMLDAAENR